MSYVALLEDAVHKALLEWANSPALQKEYVSIDYATMKANSLFQDVIFDEIVNTLKQEEEQTVTTVRLPKGAKMNSWFDFNEMLINQGGYEWEKVETYREHFTIYKAKGIKLYQMRGLDGAYYYNFSELVEGRKGVDKIADNYEQIVAKR